MPPQKENKKQFEQSVKQMENVREEIPSRRELGNQKKTKRQQLQEYVEKEMEEVQKGERKTISSNKELSEIIGLRKSTTDIYISKMNFAEYRREIRAEQQKEETRERKNRKEEKARQLKDQSVIEEKKKLGEEWIRLTYLLGYSPSSKDIASLYEEKKTSYYSHRYKRTFGEASFTDTQEKIEKYIKDNIDSFIPEKEKQLEYFEKSVPSQLRHVTRENLLMEWKRLKKVYGHPLSSHEIEELKKNKGTPYNSKMYSRKFGENTFVKAREELERIIAKESLEHPSQQNSRRDREEE